MDQINDGMKQMNVGRSRPKRVAHVFQTDFNNGPSASPEPNAHFVPGAPAPYQEPTPRPVAPAFTGGVGGDGAFTGGMARSASQQFSGQSRGKNQSYDILARIPCVADDRAYFQSTLGDDPQFCTFEHACPPPAGTEYNIIDQGTAGPNFARLSMYLVPATEQLREQTKLPLGIILSPSPSPVAGERGPYAVETADFGDDQEPVRCNRCWTYMNPAMLFVDGGTRFICNMCQFSNPTPATYFAPVDASNRRIDWQQRPELASGTYDIVVGSKFWSIPGVEPKPLRHIFAIDVSSASIQKQLPALTAQAIKKLLYDPDSRFPEKAEIAIITFDSSVQFLDLSPELEQPRVLQIADVEDPFLPIDKGFFVNPQTSKTVIEYFLDNIEKIFPHSHASEPVYGSLLLTIEKALENSGGRASVVLSGLPTWGPGALLVRENAEGPTAANGKIDELLLPNSQFYKTHARKFAELGIGLDLFSVPTFITDLANIGEVSKHSGGSQHIYQKFVPRRDGPKLIADIVKCSSGFVATSALLKVRCSNGLQVSAYHGNFQSEHNTNDLALGVITEKTSIGVLFKYDGKLDTKLDAHFQTAILYTSSDGQRKVRVINTLAGVTEQYKMVTTFVDNDACVGLIARECFSKLGIRTLKDIRFGINEKVVEIFAAYRNFAGSSAPVTQLLMPTALGEFLIFMLAIQKSKVLRDASTISDTRVDYARKVATMNVDELSLLLYPRLVAIHNLQPLDCSVDDHGHFVMPVNLRASQTVLENGGVYFLWNGVHLMLWMSQNTTSLLLQDLIGVEKLSDIDPYLNELPVLETAISQQARSLVQHFARKAGLTFLGLQIAREGLDGADLEFRSLLIEDKQHEQWGYVDYVQHIHRHVKIFLENKGSKAATSLLNETLHLDSGRGF